MLPFYTLENAIKEYSWGSTDGISYFTGIQNPSQTKMAELWIGSHKNAPSKIKNTQSNEPTTLLELISNNPTECLGKENAKKWNNTLPFLFKILSASAPLSLQVHPSKEQAQKGFERESLEGMLIDDSKKNYHDSNHKPEILVALSPFTALAGFRDKKSVVYLFSLIKNSNLHAITEHFSTTQNYIQLLSDIFLLSVSSKNEILQKLHSVCATIISNKDTKPFEYQVFSMINHLLSFYPTDIGVLAPLFLNILEIQPMEAFFIPAGIIHSYVKGTGIELMANSDNVLRCGLTEKHIDVHEVLSIIQNISFSPQIIYPDFSAGYGVYSTPAPDFEVSVEKNHSKKTIRNDLPLLLLVTNGYITIQDTNNTKILLGKGESIFIPSSTTEIEIETNGDYWAAGINTHINQKGNLI